MNNRMNSSNSKISMNEMNNEVNNEMRNEVNNNLELYYIILNF